MNKYTEKNLPVLLNYTGDTISVVPAKETKRYKTIDGRITLPSIGKPIIKSTFIKEDGALYPTIECVVEGVPDEIPGAMIIVREDVARILSGKRNDVMILYDYEPVLTNNLIKPDEIYLKGNGLAHYISSHAPKRT